MWLSKATGLLDRLVGPPSQAFHKVGAWVLAIMMLLTGADVLLRGIFNWPIMGAYDLTEYMMAIIITSGLAYVAIVKGHINAEVLLTRLSQRTQTTINIITSFLSFGLFCLATWQTFLYMTAVYGFRLTSGVLLIPVFPFVGVVCFGIALLSLVLLGNFLELLSKVKK